ncbi:unnamed protein product, partial [Phaeothamnion confervicola]
AVTESELLQALYASTQTIVSLFSMFVTIVSAYVAGLYLFLKDAPFLLRLLSFLLLSIALAFLGGAAVIQQVAQDAIFAAWSKLPNPSIPADVLNNPLPAVTVLGYPLRVVGIVLGWGAALSVYLSLGFMTFLYRWRK